MFFLKDLPTRRMMESYAARFPQMEVEAVGEALAMMRRASTLVRRLETYFASHGISQLRFLILIAIDREPDRDRLMASEIAERLDVSRPVTTRTLQGMERDGLIGTDQHGSDKRSKLIYLTADGSAKLKQVLPGYFELITSFMREQRD